jgi:hypothetical protein
VRVVRAAVQGCRVTTGQVLILFAGVCLAWLAVLIVWSSR